MRKEEVGGKEKKIPGIFIYAVSTILPILSQTGNHPLFWYPHLLLEGTEPTSDMMPHI